MSLSHQLQAQITAEVRRLVDRLAVLTAERLAAPAPPYASKAAAAHALAQRFVDVTADLEGNAPIPPLPWVDELAVADQLAVTAQDLISALAVNGASPVDNRSLAQLLDEVQRVRAAVH